MFVVIFSGGQELLPVHGRQFLQASRRQHRNSPGYSHMPLFQPQTADFLQSTDFVYEEVAKLSPPSQQLNTTSPPFFDPISPMSNATPYNSHMMNDPQQSIPVSQNMASPMSNGALSPQMQTGVLSPQQMQVASPQSNLGSPINVSMPYGSQMVQTPVSQPIQAMSDIQGHTISQPIQVADSLEQDFVSNQGMSYQYQPMGSFDAYNQQNFPPIGAPQSCAFQARGSDRDLQDVLDIIQSQGYDEVDSARIDVPKPYEETLPVPLSGQLVCRGSSQPRSLPFPSEEPCVSFTAKVQKDYNQSPQTETAQPTFTKETKAVQTRENGG